MPAKKVDHFLGALKVLMICLGSWNFRERKGSLYTIYKKMRYSVIVIFCLACLLFPYTLVVEYKCKVIVIESFTISLHILIACILYKLLETRKSKEVLEFIYVYENQRLPMETSKDRETYMVFVKENNTIVKGLVVLAFAGASVWFAVGLK